MKPSDLKIGQRLAIGIGVATSLLVALVCVAASRLAEVKSELDVISDDRLPKLVAVKDAKDNIRARAQLIRNVVLLEKDDEIRAQSDLLPGIRAAYAKLQKQLRDTTRNERGQELLTKVDRAVAALVAPTDEVVRLGLANRNAEATRQLIDVVQPAQTAALQALDEFAQFEIASTEELQASANAAYVSGVRLLVSLAVAAVVLLFVFGWLLVRSVTRPLNRAVEVSRAVAGGDLTLQFDDAGRSEMAQLMQALKRMQASLVETVTGVRDNAQGVAVASSQIAQGNHDLSARTEEQASALEQTSASMEELSGTVRKNADNAQHASTLARAASSVAVEGGETIARIVETMKAINDSARRITEIIALIDGIAFQTNILALNAAVEAARAGEQGRGFAVVAGEVRNLAQRSAEAAREIKALILTSVERVELGTSLVDRAGSTMKEIVDSIHRVTDVVGEISTASIEQAAGVAQIGEAVLQMDQATQQNAALVEESAAASDSLKQQAEQLVQAVSVFRLTAPSSSGFHAAVQQPVSAKPALPSPPSMPARSKKSTTTLPVRAPSANPAVGRKPAETRHDDQWETF